MTILHKSSHALRRVAIANKTGRKVYSHFSQPLNRTANNGSTAPSQPKSDGWLVPAAIAIFGLGFSTFSTHQLMSCRGDDMAIRKK